MNAVESPPPLVRASLISREWSMPSAQTFDMPPVSALLDRWLDGRHVVVDPFARNSRRGTLTNDLNPKTTAQHHLPADEFAAMLVRDGIRADAVLFDPPYSPRQIVECYQSAGLVVGKCDTQNAALGKAVKDSLASVLRVGGIAISFGWNSNGFGLGRGFSVEEILLVPHGGAHNDTIVVVERKLQGTLFHGGPR